MAFLLGFLTVTIFGNWKFDDDFSEIWALRFSKKKLQNDEDEKNLWMIMKKDEIKIETSMVKIGEI